MHTPDHGKSERVWSIAQRVAPEKASEITWMDQDLIYRLHETFEASRSLMLMAMMRAGMISHEQGQEINPVQLFLMAFHVGFEVGQEYKAQEDFRQMMGGDWTPEV